VFLQTTTMGTKRGKAFEANTHHLLCFGLKVILPINAESFQNVGRYCLSILESCYGRLNEEV